MNKLTRSIIITVFSVASLFAGDNYKGDIDNSKMAWVGRKVTGEHNGTIALKSASLEITKGKLSGGSFEIDMTSIVNLDIEDEGYRNKLVGHLKSDDFFSVEKFPVATFEISGIKDHSDPKSKHNVLVTGNLTIKGITKAIEFPAYVNVENEAVTAEAKIVVDRSKYDVRYGSGSFFEGLGDKLIYDDFDLNVSLKAKK